MDSSSSDMEDGVDNLEEQPVWEGERCEPLGAAKDNLSDEMDSQDYDRGDICELQRLQTLEEEQEILSTSLFSLTSHLAQVQFRLRQIVEAPPDDKEKMLRSLEEFTFRGVPDLGSIIGVGNGVGVEEISGHSAGCSECQKLDEKLKEHRIKQLHFIEQLKVQLREIDAFSGDGISACPGTKEYMDRRNVIINDLKQNMSTNVKSLNEREAERWQRPLTGEELRHRSACSARSGGAGGDNQDLIVLLQGQVEDMQRFITLLKRGSLNLQSDSDATDRPIQKKPQKETRKSKISSTASKNDELRAETVNLMKKIVALLQMFAVAQFGCSSNVFHKNDLKKSNMANHWGDLRARLEMSVDAVANLSKRNSSRPSSGLGNYDSDSEENSVILHNVPLTTAVRKHLAINIRDLIQHGLLPYGEINSVVPFIGCFPMRRNSHSKCMHAWELILRFYHFNNGDSYNSTPARKLSQSFNLDIVGGTAISNKQSMLSAIGAILASHGPYKRSSDSHFKAFICASLNAQKLVAWLNLLFKNKSLMQMCYSSTSYVTNTGFQDSLQSLDRLTPYKFNLPVDLAVRQFQNIKDVFM